MAGDSVTGQQPADDKGAQKTRHRYRRKKPSVDKNRRIRRETPARERTKRLDQAADKASTPAPKISAPPVASPIEPLSPNLRRVPAKPRARTPVARRRLPCGKRKKTKAKKQQDTDAAGPATEPMPKAEKEKLRNLRRIPSWLDSDTPPHLIRAKTPAPQPAITPAAKITVPGLFSSAAPSPQPAPPTAAAQREREVHREKIADRPVKRAVTDREGPPTRKDTTRFDQPGGQWPIAILDREQPVGLGDVVSERDEPIPCQTSDKVELSPEYEVCGGDRVTVSPRKDESVSTKSSKNRISLSSGVQFWRRKRIVVRQRCIKYRTMLLLVVSLSAFVAVALCVGMGIYEYTLLEDKKAAGRAK